MRRTILDMDLITHEGNVIGISLGYDYCAEHEWGIKDIYNTFGCQTKGEIGYESKRNTKVPSSLVFHETKKSVVLIYDGYFDKEEDDPAQYHKSPQLDMRGDVIATAWDSKSFGIRVLKDSSERSQKAAEFLRTLYKAFQKTDGIITLNGSTNLFGGAGLLLLDYTKIPDDAKQRAREADKANREEKELFRRLEEASGIFPLLEKAGKRFLSLSIGSLDNKGNPLWWMNNWDSEDNYGWYTTEELKLWAENKGPVVECRPE